MATASPPVVACAREFVAAKARMRSRRMRHEHMQLEQWVELSIARNERGAKAYCGGVRRICLVIFTFSLDSHISLLFVLEGLVQNSIARFAYRPQDFWALWDRILLPCTW